MGPHIGQMERRVRVRVIWVSGGVDRGRGWGSERVGWADGAVAMACTRATRGSCQ